MKKDILFKCLIAFLFGFTVFCMIRRDGLIVGGQADDDVFTECLHNLENDPEKRDELKGYCLPFKENDDRVLGSTTTKRWCYSSSKALVEHYLEACVSQDNIDYRAARLFNVYGPRLKGRVVAYFLKNSLQNKDLDINGTGKQTRCFTYIDDVIEAFNLILHADNCKNQIFNIGSNNEISIEEFAKKIIKITKSKSKLRKVSYNEQFGKSYEDIDRRVPDISKIENYVNWKPKTSLEDGINLTLKLAFKK